MALATASQEVRKKLYSGCAGGWLRRPATRHTGVAVKPSQRGGFTGYRLCRRPIQHSMHRCVESLRLQAWQELMLQAWRPRGCRPGWLAGISGQSVRVPTSLAVGPTRRTDAAGQNVSVPTSLAVGPTRRTDAAGLESSRLQAWLAGRDLWPEC